MTLPLSSNITEHIENLAAQCGEPVRAFLAACGKRRLRGVVATRFHRWQTRLADPVDASEALFQTVGVPRQIVIDHQVRALRLMPSPRRRRKQYLHLGVVFEGFLYPQTLFATDAAVDDDHSFFAAERRGDALSR